MHRARFGAASSTGLRRAGKPLRLGGRIDFYRWFTELWQGKALGKTVAWISILVSLGLYLFACSLPGSRYVNESKESDEPD